jgi:hypothetical protein
MVGEWWVMNWKHLETRDRPLIEALSWNFRGEDVHFSQNTLLPDWDSDEALPRATLRCSISIYLIGLLATCSYAVVLRGLFFDRKDGVDVFLRNVFKRTTWPYMREASILRQWYTSQSYLEQLRQSVVQWLVLQLPKGTSYIPKLRLLPSFLPHTCWNLPLLGL